MIRLHSNELLKPARNADPKIPRVPYPREDHSELETLATEHRGLVFWLVKETLKNQAAIMKRSMMLLIPACLLFASLALIAGILLSGSGFANLQSRLPFILGEVLAALLLAVSIILTLYGAAFVSLSNPTLSIPGDTLPRQQVLNMARADLARLRQVERQTSKLFRGAVLFFLIALIPYLLVIFTLIL